MFGWHISIEHRYFKSKRNEYRLRVWKAVKYRPPAKKGVLTPYPITENKEITGAPVEKEMK